MFKRCSLRAGVVQVLVKDVKRFEKESRERWQGAVTIDLGKGVNSMRASEFKTYLDDTIKTHSKQAFRSVVAGKVLSYPDRREVDYVDAGCRYYVTGDLAGGYFENSQRWGPRVNGVRSNVTKPGLRYAGEKW